jgi:hypothetical protein
MPDRRPGEKQEPRRAGPRSPTDEAIERLSMHAGKLMLTLLCGGTALGALAGAAVDPELQAPPEPAWHAIAPDIIFTQASRQLVAAPPEDLNPPGWFDYRRPGFAERFAGFPPEEDQPSTEAAAAPPGYAPAPAAEPLTVGDVPAALAPPAGAIDPGASAADRAAAVAQRVIEAEAALAPEPPAEPGPNAALPAGETAVIF